MSFKEHDQVTPEDVAERLIVAVARSNSGPDAIHAIIALNAEDLRQQARESALRYKVMCMFSLSLSFSLYLSLSLSLSISFHFSEWTAFVSL
jgi:hypothetical protein